MQYIKIAKWSAFQHYKKRNPPWIKLYAWILDNDEFDCMQDASKLLYFCLLLFASRRDNKIKHDFKWLQKKLPIDTNITQKTLQPLIDSGFIVCYQDASDVLAVCKQDAIPETETEERQRRGETEKKKYLDFVLLKQEEHDKLVNQFGIKGTKERILSLNNYIGSKGKKYKSHYHTILSWERANKTITKQKENLDDQWDNQCGDWLRQSSKETIQNHTSFCKRLKGVDFRTWAESVNVLVKDVTC